MESENSAINKTITNFSRDFPPGGGSISNQTLKNPSIRNYTREFPPGCGTNISPKIPQIPPKDSRHWRRTVSATKTKPRFPPNQREKVLEILRLFRERCGKVSGVTRVDVKAYSELKSEGKIVSKPSLMIGSVPGIEVGDRFHYRIELIIVGLHRLLQGGIDSMELNGSKYATCIVANEGHSDKLNDSNVLIYVGEGGVLKPSEFGVPPDQELKGGNRALWNSMKENKVVRVVRGLKLGFSRQQKTVYVYDGLYGVEACEKKKGPQGNVILEFKLVRNAGQAAVQWRNCRLGWV